jgi:hypothetical protein
MAVTICWSAKGGSGTTVVSACLALTHPSDSILVDLAGDLPATLGVAEPSGQGLVDWFASDAPPAALLDLAIDVDATTRVIPRGAGDLDRSSTRWFELTAWLASRIAHVVVDAGIGPPPPALFEDEARGLLVTRPCYLALRRAVAMSIRPDGIVLVVEPGRSLRAGDVARTLGAPIVATISVDPAVARAVDAGLLRARLPRAIGRELRGAA